ncbi:MAG: hypothetical protein AB8G86_00410 [Saprospiraceae bacterium]
MRHLKLYSCLVCLFITPISFAQIPVGAVIDAGLIGDNTIVSLAEGVTNFLLKKERPLQENIKNVQAFFQKAETVVNKAVKNMRMVREIVETEKDIIELYTRSINKLNEPIDEDGDGIDDLEFLDKWKQVQILLAFTKEAASVFELFTNLIEDNAFTMNDKGRIIFLEKTYKDMLLIKRAMRAQLRRINKQIYTYRRQRRQLKTYSAFFEIN